MLKTNQLKEISNNIIEDFKKNKESCLNKSIIEIPLVIVIEFSFVTLIFHILSIDLIRFSVKLKQRSCLLGVLLLPEEMYIMVVK